MTLDKCMGLLERSERDGTEKLQLACVVAVIRRVRAGERTGFLDEYGLFYAFNSIGKSLRPFNR